MNVSEGNREFDSSAEIGICDRIPGIENTARSMNVILFSTQKNERY
jgi:hypothetical protein